MLFLDVIYVEGSKAAWFCWVKAPTSAELTVLAHTMAQRIGRLMNLPFVGCFLPCPQCFRGQFTEETTVISGKLAHVPEAPTARDFVD